MGYIVLANCMLYVVDYMCFESYMSTGHCPQILDTKSLTDTQQLNNSVCQAAVSCIGCWLSHSAQSSVQQLPPSPESFTVV